MTKIEKKFKELKNKKEKGLILYLTVGFPSIDKSIEIIKNCEKNGVDIIELGIPFSDPIADGPIIQHTSSEALKNGITTDTCFQIANELKNEIKIPYLFMTYYNPVYKYGIEKFVEKCVESGVSGLIIPDLPYEESFYIRKMLRNNDMNLIYFLTPYTKEERMKKILKKGNGFIYFVSLAGVTGPRESLNLNLIIESLKKIKKISDKPVALGFGISNKEQIKQIKSYVDGIIVGSSFLQKLIENEDEAIKLIKEFKEELSY
ncbi:MAG: tryptophan synthase subunit alpha [Candidatus Omnitrophica bacterium]|nr:tryptophan synthase subunit alpha [Candidatus Omnitrophota bacterium]MCM8806636.1 tryptophan synthase subunit alpha [Candidatus Omnitrophota bacterium]